MITIHPHRFFLGHHKSYFAPSGTMIKEEKHPKGCWIGLFMQDFSHTTRYYIVTRPNRHIRYADTIKPKTYSYTDGGKYTFVDSDFISFTDSRGCFVDFDKAQKYYDHIMSDPVHPAVRTPYKDNHVRDSQRSRVYQWENQYIPNERDMTVDQVIEFTEHIYSNVRHITKHPLKLTFDKRGGCYQRLNTVNLAPYGYEKHYIIHEMAHWVMQFTHQENRVAAHGPEFVGVYMLMLERFHDHTLDKLKEDATRDRVKFHILDGGFDEITNRIY